MTIDPKANAELLEIMALADRWSRPLSEILNMHPAEFDLWMQYFKLKNKG